MRSPRSANSHKPIKSRLKPASPTITLFAQPASQSTPPAAGNHTMTAMRRRMARPSPSPPPRATARSFIRSANGTDTAARELGYSRKPLRWSHAMDATPAASSGPWHFLHFKGTFGARRVISALSKACLVPDVSNRRGQGTFGGRPDGSLPPGAPMTKPKQCPTPFSQRRPSFRCP